MAATVTVSVAGLSAALPGVLAGIAPGRIVWPTKVIGQMVVSDVKSNFANQRGPDGVRWRQLSRPRPGGGNLALRDRGLLLGSITAAATADTVAVGSGLEYAGVHQFGGVIAPKAAKALAIPVTKEAARAGSPRRFPRPLFLLKGKAGKPGCLAESKETGRGKAKTKTVVVHYVLVAKVVVPARPYLGFSAGLLGRVERLVSDLGVKAVSGG